MTDHPAALVALAAARPYGLEFATSPSGQLYLYTELAAPPEVVAGLNSHTAELVAELVAEVARPWGSAAPMVAWFLISHPPRQPFELDGALILDPERWWGALQKAVRRGPRRGHTAAVKHTVKALHRLFHTPPAEPSDVAA